MPLGPQFESDSVTPNSNTQCILTVLNMVDVEQPQKEEEHIESHEEEGNEEVLRRLQVLLWLVGSM